jgi:threonine synthase
VRKLLAIGSPADGPFAIRLIRESGGWAEDISDPEIIDSIKLLAETEGIFGETAAGVTTGVAAKLIQQGRIKSDETTVVCVTGNGLKTTDALVADFPLVDAIEPRLEAFEALLQTHLKDAVNA